MMKKTILLLSSTVLLAHSTLACSFTASGTAMPVSCPGAANGMITMTTTGSLGAVAYSIDGGATYQSGNVFVGLPMGTYIITVLDSGDMCTEAITVPVGTAPPLTTAASTASPTCAGACDGTVITTVMGGTPSYTYMWNTGSTTPVLTGVCAGVYTCTIVDAAGCVTSLTTTVPDPPAVTPSVVSVTPSTCGACDGEIVVTVTGGSAPYAYAMDGGSLTGVATFTGLCAGMHTVTVTDANGCSTSLDIPVNSAGSVTLSTSSVTAPGCGLCDGEVQLAASGGTGASTYSIDGTTYGPSNTFSGLCAGVYIFWAQDAAGCTGILTVPVSSPAISGLTVSPSINHETGIGLSDGSIDLALTGGSGSYTFLWSNGATTEDIYSLTAGTYTVTISDGSGNCNTYTYTVSTMPAYGLITGQVYIDANGNCTFDAGDSPISYYGVVAGGYNTSTGTAGIYNFYLPTGTYAIAPASSPYMTLSSGCGVSGSATVTTGSTTTIDFPMTVTSAVCDGSVTLSNMGIVPGFMGQNMLYVYNHGYTPLNGTLTTTVPQYTSYVSASVAPASVSGDTVIFNITGLAPLSGMIINVSFGCPATPGLLGLPSISYADFAVTSCTDINPGNNSTAYTRVITGSFDPNEKHVMPQGDVELSQQEFSYHIQFQNTGNGPAVNISVTDTLSDLLDPATIQILQASHPMEFSLIDGHIMHFRFENIMLPDSTSDEPGSHGHIHFTIDRKNTVTIGDVIENTANIYFDFNPPVITNTTQNEFVVITGTNEITANDADFTVYPNPNDGMAWLKLKGLNSATCKVFDVAGRMLLSQSLNAQQDTAIDLSKLGKGVYTINVSDGHSSVTKQLIRK